MRTSAHGRADLHVHTAWSDGAQRPEEIVNAVQGRVGSAVTRFEGRDASDLRRALLAGRTRAHVDWSWTAGKLPLHLKIQLRSAYRFFRHNRQRVNVGTLP